ncbi:hypothetical protein Z043_100457 [Scleropages formosus]|uniref:NID domain-containing protein n=1 Tax=Scleropages formosus TaxID=113540 RepID=A0A0P7VDN1_SCLFO|nr:hypothetical protein Z043_100457 [Scleropages formosus]
MSAAASVRGAETKVKVYSGHRAASRLCFADGPHPALNMSSDETILAQSQSEQKALLSAIKDHKHFAEEFRQRTVKLKEDLEEEEEDRAKNQQSIKVKINTVQMEASRLKTEVGRAEEELSHLDQLSKELKQQTEVSTAMPEKSVVFTGALSEDMDTCSFDMKPYIVFPMEGGTALITFEEEEVAQNILSLKEHQVRLGECFIRVEAQTVQVLEPCHIEVRRRSFL